MTRSNSVGTVGCSRRPRHCQLCQSDSNFLLGRAPLVPTGVLVAEGLVVKGDGEAVSSVAKAGSRKTFITVIGDQQIALTTKQLIA